MSLDPGCVRVLDCAPISVELLTFVVDWQKNSGEPTADETWLELRCTYESKDGEEMALAISPLPDIGPGDVIDVVAAPVIGSRFGDDFSKPPTQLAVGPLLQRATDGWVVENPSSG
jgi:hypothetical protein